MLPLLLAVAVSAPPSAEAVAAAKSLTSKQKHDIAVKVKVAKAKGDQDAEATVAGQFEIPAKAVGLVLAELKRNKGKTDEEIAAKRKKEEQAEAAESSELKRRRDEAEKQSKAESKKKPNPNDAADLLWDMPNNPGRGRPSRPAAPTNQQTKPEKDKSGTAIRAETYDRFTKEHNVTCICLIAAHEANGIIGHAVMLGWLDNRDTKQCKELNVLYTISHNAPCKFDRDRSTVLLVDGKTHILAEAGIDLTPREYVVTESLGSNIKRDQIEAIASCKTLEARFGPFEVKFTDAQIVAIKRMMADYPAYGKSRR